MEYSPKDKIIIAHPNEVPILLQLHTIWKNSLDFIVELEYLQDFNEVVPGVFNPRRVIEYMQEKHKLHAFVYKNRPDLVERIVFAYTDTKHIIEMEFSNNMSFRNDVVIICYLHDSVQFFFKTCPEHRLIHMLMKLMVDKYKIHDLTFNFDPNNITLFNMWYSFPSISMDLYGNYDNFLQRVASIFPNMNLPDMMFLTVFERIWRILPKLSNPPIAILIAVYLKTNYFCSKAVQTSLSEIYSTVLDHCNSTDFPETLKIVLCKRWNIVITLDDEHQFNSCFMLHYNEAKCQIRKLRQLERVINKAGVEAILSQM